MWKMIFPKLSEHFDQWFIFSSTAQLLLASRERAMVID
jgi:hypothetical protein